MNEINDNNCSINERKNQIIDEFHQKKEEIKQILDHQEKIRQIETGEHDKELKQVFKHLKNKTPNWNGKYR